MSYKRLASDWLCALILGITLWAVTWWMDRCSLGLQSDVYIMTWGSVGNALPFLLLFILLLFLTNRLLTSLVVVFVLSSLFYYANYKKNEYLGKPLSGDDFIFVRYLDWGVLDLFSAYVDVERIVLTSFFVFLIILGFVFYEEVFFKGKSWPRFLSAIVLSGLLILAIKSEMIDGFYNFKLMRFSWDDKTSVLHAGVMSKIIYSSIKDKAANDEPVNYKSVDHILDRYSVAREVSSDGGIIGDLPDVIIVQSEAFSDPTLLKGLDNLRSLLPVYANAVAQGAAGFMNVPTFGGGTIRTEYEVLTGVPLLAYPKIEFPYLQLKTSNVDSLALQLKNNGYYSTAIHGNTGSFWNRTDFYRRAHFDRFLTISDFSKTLHADGFFASDESMTDLIIEQLNDEREKNKFIFAVSIEAHGPYLAQNEDLENSGVADLSNELSPQARLELSNYLYHIRNADIQLGRLYDYLEKRNKPYILAFYGDHLPAFISVYNEVSFKNNLPAKSQKVPWVVFTNLPDKSFDIPASWSLGAAILDKAKIKTSPYLKLINNFIDKGRLHKPDSDFIDLLSVSRLQVQGKLVEYLGGGESAK